MKYWISFHRAGRWRRYYFEEKDDGFALQAAHVWLNTRTVAPDSPAFLIRRAKLGDEGVTRKLLGCAVDYEGVLTDWTFNLGEDGVWR